MLIKGAEAEVFCGVKCEVICIYVKYMIKGYSSKHVHYVSMAVDCKGVQGI